MARLFKIRVDDFSVGFGKRLLRVGKLGDTEYNIRAIPLGGFVKIAGMEPDEEPINQAKDAVLKRSSDDRTGDDPDAREIPLLAENRDSGSTYMGEDGFNAKPLWQRSLVILGGPVMSFITGVAILCLLGCTFGIPIGKSIARVAQVQPGGEGQRIGLQAGDYIIAFNGVPVKDGADMVNTIHDSLGKTLILTIKRDGNVMTLPAAKPRGALDLKNKPVTEVEVLDPTVLAAIGLKAGDQLVKFNGDDIQTPAQFNTILVKNAGKAVKIAVGRGMDGSELKGTIPATIGNDLPTLDQHQVAILNFNPDNALVKMGFRKSVATGWDLTKSIFITLGELVKTKQIQNATGGVVSMASTTSVMVKDGISHVMLMAAQVSISLAIFNMLPIPILDGGHLLSFFIEWVRRGKKMTPQMQSAFMMTGLAIVVLLVVLINGKDILNLLRHNVVQ